MSQFQNLCGEWTGKSLNLVTGEVRAGTIWCKSWSCEYCAPIRKKQLMRQAANGDPDKFITLTSRYRPNEMTPHQAAQELVHAWRMVVQRAKRDKLITTMQYIAVFELTQKGWPHLHILARCSFLAQEWLSARLKEYADSPVCHVRAVKSPKRAAWYVAKYTAKAPEKFQGCKRYWRTLGYDLSPDKRDKCLHDHFQGYISQTHITHVADLYTSHGYGVEWDSDHSFTATPTEIDFWRLERRKYQRNHSPPYKEQRTCISTLKTKA
jgi:hypothetical protein